jgi:cytochrome b5
LKRGPNDPAPKTAATDKVSAGPGGKGIETGMGVMLYAVILIGGAAAFGAYKYMQSQETK